LEKVDAVLARYRKVEEQAFELLGDGNKARSKRLGKGLDMLLEDAAQDAAS
jgi:hypothetical protein